MRAGKVLGLLVGAGMCALALPAQAQVDSGSENSAQFGHIDQNSAGITNGSVACAPTATYNSFVYLNTAFPSAGLSALLDTTPAGAINTLSSDIPGGIPASGGNALATGKSTYINNAGLSNKITVESLGNNATLSPNTAARFIAQQLGQGQDVEMGFLWSDSAGNLVGNGHVVTITSINYNESTQTGSMSIVDPWDGVVIPGGGLSVGNGELLLGYSGGGAGTGGADGNDPDNPGHAGFGAISFVTAESVAGVPEPAAVGVIAVAGLFIIRRRRQTI